MTLQEQRLYELMVKDSQVLRYKKFKEQNTNLPSLTRDNHIRVREPRRKPQYRWTQERLQILVDQLNLGVKQVEIAKVLGTTEDSIAGMTFRLKKGSKRFMGLRGLRGLKNVSGH